MSIDQTQTKMRSIDFPKFSNSMYFYLKFVISLLMSYKTQKTPKLAKTSENNKAKGLTSVNQGVQIYNIWHSSKTKDYEWCKGKKIEDVIPHTYIYIYIWFE
jgi:hypothetical protein